MENRFGNFAKLVLTHRLAFLLGLSLTFLCVGAGTLRLDVAFSFQAFVGSRDAAIQTLRAHVERWGSDDATLFVVVKSEDGILDESKLSVLNETLTRLKQDERIDEVIGLPMMPLTQPNAAMAGASTLVEQFRAANTAEAQARLRAQVLSQSEIVPLILSADGKVTTIFCRLHIDADDITAFRPVVTGIRRLLDEEESRTGLEFKIAGIPAVRSEFVDLLIRDQTLFMSVALVSVLVLLFLLFRAVHGVVIPVVASIVPTVILFGIMGWVSEPIGILSQVYITLIPVIALADTIHIVTRYHQEVWRLEPTGKIDGAAQRDAIVIAMGHTGAACLFTSVTTMVGFFSLYIADMQVLHSFGLYAGIGVAISFGCLLVILPLGLSQVKDVGQAPGDDDKMSPFENGLATIAGASVKHPLRIIAATGVFCVLAVGIGSLVRVDNRLNDVLGDAHEVSQANHLVDEHLAGVVTIQVSLLASKGALGSLEVLQRIDALEKSLARLEDARAVRGPASALRALNRAVVGMDELPSSPALIAQLWLIAGDAAPTKALLLEDLSAGRVVVHLPDLGGARMEELSTIILPAVERHFPAGGDVEATVTGVNWIAYQSFNRLSRELLWSLMGAFLFICGLIAFLFRSLSTAILSMVPNTVPLLVTLATMGVMGWRLDPPSSIVFVVALGIAVDDTIHLLARIREESHRLHAEGIDDVTLPAVVLAVRKTGRALTITTVLLVVGFGVNSMSSFPMNRVFGVLGSVAVFSALWCDLVILPALLSAADRFRRRGPGGDIAQKTPR